jgi:hypothetical protein
MKGTHLGEFEEIVLLTVAVLIDDAYGFTIMSEIEKRSNRSISIGAMRTTLSRLEEKGFLKSKLGEATKVRGGKRKRYFIFKGLMISICISNSLGKVIYMASFPMSWTNPATNNSLLPFFKSTAIIFAARAQ